MASTIFFKDFIAALARTGRTIFYCSHVMDVVERVCDRIAILDRGRLVADGTMEELSASAPGSSLETVFSELTAQVDSADRVARLCELLEA